MILIDIETKLKEIDPYVYYGIVDSSRKETIWDYTVFNRVIIRHSDNKTSSSDFFDVHIIRENYIPDGIEDEVIEKLCSLPGVKLAVKESEFAYVQKPNTNIVIEMLTIHFVRARKSNA